MREVTPLAIEAFVGMDERPIVVSAAQQVNIALEFAAGGPWPVQLAFSTPDAPAEPAVPIAILSLLGNAVGDGRPVVEIEAVWRDSLASRLDAGRRTVLICTVLRVVAEPNHRAERLERIRRLNRMAADLSQTFDLHVVDLDRTLGFYGAELLGCDYRLGSRRGIEAAGHAMASALLAADLRGLVPSDLQAEAAQRHGGLHQLGAAVDRRVAATEAPAR